LIYHRIDSTPITGRDYDEPDKIAIAYTVLGRIDGPNGTAVIHVAKWEAGRGQEETKLTPGQFADWRLMFNRPPYES